jgi:predicted metal-dependent hydrolase
MRLGDLQLGLFDWLLPAPSAHRATRQESQPIQPNGSARTHEEPVHYQPVHPQANRWIEHEGRRLHFYLRRGKRRTIGLQVGSDGLTVAAPRWALAGDVTQAVVERAAWAVEKLREVRERDELHHRQSIQWADGVSIPYLGQMLTVQLDPTVRSEGLERHALEGGQPVLRVRLVADANATQIREKVQAWLVKQAKELFAQRLDEYAPRLGVQWRRLRLSQARTRWGSANAQGTICLNWRLIHHALPVIDYVVVHELSHLREMNHSSAFWDTVASVMPDYKHNMRVLKKETLPPWE